MARAARVQRRCISRRKPRSRSQAAPAITSRLTSSPPAKYAPMRRESRSVVPASQAAISPMPTRMAAAVAMRLARAAPALQPVRPRFGHLAAENHGGTYFANAQQRGQSEQQRGEDADRQTLRGRHQIEAHMRRHREVAPDQNRKRALHQRPETRRPATPPARPSASVCAR